VRFLPFVVHADKPIRAVGLSRTTIAEGQLEDGTVIPKGFECAIDLKRLHRDSENYPNPHVFDPFRFSKLREEEQSDVRYGYTTVDKNYLVFGAGRHACAGRFFASMMLKIVLARLLLAYDLSLPSNTVKPKNVTFNAGIVPDTKAEIVFKRRMTTKVA